MKRWKKIFFYFLIGMPFVLGIGATWYLNSNAFKNRLRQSIEEAISKQTGGICRISEVEIYWLPPHVDLKNFLLQKKGSGEISPFLRVNSISIQPGIFDLFRLSHLSSVVFYSPQILVETDREGNSNLPSPHLPSGEIDLFQIKIDRLVISKGSLNWTQRQWSLNATLRNFNLSTRYQSAPESYHTDLAYDEAWLKWDRHEWRCGLTLSLDLLNNRLQIQKSNLTFASARLDFQGQFENLHSPRGWVDFQSQLPAGVLRPLYSGREKLDGVFSLRGKIQLQNSSWESHGHIEGRNLAIDIARISHISSLYEANPKELSFKNILIAGMGGQLEGMFRIENPLAVRRYQGDLKFQSIDLLALSRLARFNQYNLAGKLHGHLQASWSDSWRNFVGNGNLTLIPPTLFSSTISPGVRIIPVGGRLNFELRRWNSTFHDSYLQLPHTRLSFQGTLSPLETSRMALQLESSDLRDFSFAGLPGQGQVQFHGEVSGTFANPKLIGDFQAQALSYNAISLDEVKARITATKREILFHQGSFRKKQSRLNFQGSVALDKARLLQVAGFDLQLSYQKVFLEDLFDLWGEVPEISGLIDGTARLSGDLSEFSLEGESEVNQVVYEGQSIDSGKFSFQGSRRNLHLPRFRLKLGRGTLEGQANLNLVEKKVQGNLVATRIPLSKIHRVQLLDSSITGFLDQMQIQIDGAWENPGLNGTMAMKEVEIGGESLGDFTAELHSGDQKLRFLLKGGSQAGSLVSDGIVSLNPPYEIDGRGSFNQLRLTPYVRKFLPATSATFNCAVDGDIQLSGEWNSWRQLKVTSKIRAMSIDFESAHIRAAQPFSVELQNERLQIKNGNFTGKGTSLSIDGTFEVQPAHRLDLALDGQVDLSLLNEFVPQLAARGNGKISAQLRGTIQEPRMKGSFALSDGQFAYSDLPNSLSEVQALLRFDENQVNISRFTAISGGGKVEIGGAWVFGPQGIKLINLRVTGREVRLRYPEGMRNVLDLNLALRGSQKAFLLSGQVNVLSASFLKDYDPITRILENRRSRILLPGSSSFGDTLSLDLAVSANRSIRLDTALVKLNSLADLRIKGTLANPILTGRLEADGGDIYFQGTRYRINRGRVDFNNLARLDPHIDLEAETNVRDYRVILNLSGTAEKFKADLRSEPPLPTVELISLVSSGGTTNPDQIYSRTSLPFAATGRHLDSSASASALLSEGVSLKVGSRVKRIFGIDRFRVDPGLFGRPEDRGARVTVGQQITRNLSITYSTSVAANEQQIILVEYDINDATSIIASRDVDGFFGVDLRFRKRLRQKHR